MTFEVSMSTCIIQIVSLGPCTVLDRALYSGSHRDPAKGRPGTQHFSDKTVPVSIELPRWGVTFTFSKGWARVRKTFQVWTFNVCIKELILYHTLFIFIFIGYWDSPLVESKPESQLAWTLGLFACLRNGWNSSSTPWFRATANQDIKAKASIPQRRTSL